MHNCKASARLTSLLGLVGLICCGLTSAQDGSVVSGQQQQQQPQQQVVDPAKIAQFERFKNDPDYLESYEPTVIAIPEIQANFVRSLVAKDVELYMEVVDEGIAKRNTMAPSMKLMWKYSKKILGRFITNRRAEKKLPERKEPLPSFFTYLATMVEKILDRGAAIMKERAYTKANVDVSAMRAQISNIFGTIQRVVDKSPLGAYHKWEQLKVYRNASAPQAGWTELVEEAADASAVSSRHLHLPTS